MLLQTYYRRSIRGRIGFYVSSDLDTRFTIRKPASESYMSLKMELSLEKGLEAFRHYRLRHSGSHVSDELRKKLLNPCECWNTHNFFK